MGQRTKLARRALLRGAGLAALTTYVAPVLIGMDMARASDTSDVSGPSGVVRRQPRRAAPRRPEIVIVSETDITDQLRSSGYNVLQSRELTQARIYRLNPPRGRAPAAAKADLARQFPDATLDDNALYRTEAFLCEDNVCLAHTAIQWPASASQLAVKIGMIDTGINTDHAALKGQKLRVIQADVGNRSRAGQAHGTAIATILIGRLDSRTPGLLPNAELIAAEAFFKNGANERADAYALVDAIDRMIAEKVSVINLSFAGPANRVLHEMIRRADQAGILLVAAAGNGGAGGKPAYPGAWPEVIAVTAVDKQMRPYRQANRGDYIDFAAPGVNLWAAASVSGGKLRSGTSYAAPFVTAALAVQKARQPTHSSQEALRNLQACVTDLGDAGRDEIFGDGFILFDNQCDT